MNPESFLQGYLTGVALHNHLRPIRNARNVRILRLRRKSDGKEKLLILKFKVKDALPPTETASP